MIRSISIVAILCGIALGTPPPIIQEGKILRCAKWFPADPCFRKATFYTQCYVPYDWKHSHVKKQEMLSNAESDENLVGIPEYMATLLDSSNFHVTSTDEDWPDHDPAILETLTDQSANNTLPSTSYLIDLKGADAPCCHFSEPCYQFFLELSRKYRGRAWDEWDKHEQETYYKILCCLASWALTCGGMVPDKPAVIRAPPKCTMPKGHDPWA